MQIDKKDYNPEQHDVFKALSVRQPYADLLTHVLFRDDAGNYHAGKTIEVRSRNTNYRGDVLICSSAVPVIPGRPAGVTCGFVELYDVKPVADFTNEDWLQTCIPEPVRPLSGYGWMMRNPRRVVEMPIKGKLGFYDLIVPKGDITEYPLEMALGSDGWDMINKRIK